METIIISNCCLGNMVISKLLNHQHNNPFIDTLIPEDEHFLKLTRNPIGYLFSEPTCDNNPSNLTNYSLQTKGVWYNNPAIKPGYPIIHLKDVEIHCIHENTNDEALNKFKRRIERFKNIINNGNYKIINIMTWHNLFTKQNNDNYRDFIDEYLKDNTNEKIISLFAGPPKYINNKNYIQDDFFNLIIHRRIDNVNINIDFYKERDIIENFIKQKNIL